MSEADFEARERARRREIAWALAVTLAPALAVRIAEREDEILGRFDPDERAVVRPDWPVSRQAVVACLPEAVEVVLDALAEGFSPWLLERVRDRCVTHTPQPSSS